MSLGQFKNAIKSQVGTSTPGGDPATDGFTTIYKTPPTQTSYIIQLDIASRGTTGVQISARVRDDSEAETAFIISQAPVPVGSTLQVIDSQKIVLESNDSIEVKCETLDESVDVILSLVEDVNS